MTLDRFHVLRNLITIYGSADAPAVLARIEGLVRTHSPNRPGAKPHRLSESDAILITYPDQVQAPGERPLRTLGLVADEYLAGLVDTIHILPFFPSSSDDGFSVTDYQTVAPGNGDWGDIQKISRRFRLMFDAVINHASVQGAWFLGFLRGEKAFAEFFLEIHGTPDLSSVVRPRTTPLLTNVTSPDGPRPIWTTFGADQADFNYRNPEVLLRILETLLFYVRQGARLIRLDAVAYVWKELGTSCIHLPGAHAIVRVIRGALQAAAPETMLLTETNVEQRENLLYLGGDEPEAHMAYNFALPPLLLRAFHTAESTKLTDWAAAIPALPDETALVNVLATHDGMGLNGCREVLAEWEIDELTHCIEAAGGHVSRRANLRGGSDPYELNINYLDALDAVAGVVDEAQTIRRFITAHAVMLSLKGVPAIYFHSLFGSRGWPAGVKQTGRFRSINREKLEYSDLRTQLADPTSFRSKIYSELARLLIARRTCPAFSPFAGQEVLRAGTGVFALLRGDGEARRQILCIHNVSPRTQPFDCGLWKAMLTAPSAVDDVGGQQFKIPTNGKIQLAPFGSFWLRIVDGDEGVDEHVGMRSLRRYGKT